MKVLNLKDIASVINVTSRKLKVIMYLLLNKCCLGMSVYIMLLKLLWSISPNLAYYAPEIQGTYIYYMATCQCQLNLLLPETHAAFQYFS